MTAPSNDTRAGGVPSPSSNKNVFGVTVVKVLRFRPCGPAATRGASTTKVKRTKVISCCGEQIRGGLTSVCCDRAAHEGRGKYDKRVGERDHVVRSVTSLNLLNLIIVRPGSSPFIRCG